MASTLLHLPPPSRRYVTAVALSPIMPWVATGSMDRSVKVWRIGDAVSSAGKKTRTGCSGIVYWWKVSKVML